MIVFPKAKINLGLSITEIRGDGFHNIETIFYPVGLCDALEFVLSSNPSSKDELTVTGIYTGVVPEENLVMKAIRKLREKHSLPWLRMHLHKAIPIGAGLGGGSSDAACVLTGINRFFSLSIDPDDLKSMALEIGSDCPFFIDGKPAYATGRGEVMNPVEPVLSGYYLLLINPGVEINTREAYQNCHPKIPSASLTESVAHDISEWKDLIVNDFEDFAFNKHPIIGEIKNELYKTGALYSAMSGSGSSVYGIFSKKPDIKCFLSKMLIYEGVM